MTLVVDAGAAGRGLQLPARRAGLLVPVRRHRHRLPRLGRRRRSPATSARRPAATSTRSLTGLRAQPEPKPKRFAMNYHLLALREGAPRVRVQVWLDDGEPIASVVPVWPTADWHEREAWDLMGIPVAGHPNLTRILMEDDWVGHPLRKDYPIGGEPVRFSERRMTVTTRRRTTPPTRAADLRGHAHPVDRPDDPRGARRCCATRATCSRSTSARTTRRRTASSASSSSSPASRSSACAPSSATCTRASRRRWSKRRGGRRSRTRERIDYLAFQNNELAFVLAIEKLLGIEVPRKATWMRTLLCELNRIHSHLVWLGRPRSRSGRSRCSGTRSASATRSSTSSRWSPACACTRATSRPAASPRTSRRVLRRVPRLHRADAEGRRRVRERSSTATASGWSGREGIGLLSADDAIALGQSGPVLRASGINWDLRKDEPYLAYDEVDFRVPSTSTATSTTATACTWRRCASPRGSSSSASTGSRGCRTSRGSRTTARSCCRRARSCTPRWSR